MDPCPFIRLIVESLSLKLPPAGRANKSSTGDGLHPTATPCFCKIAFKTYFSPQTAVLPLGDPPADPSSAAAAAAAVFHLDPAAIRRISGSPTTLQLSVFSGRTGRTCGVSSGKRLGRVKVRIDLDVTGSPRPVVHHSGWISLGHDHSGKPSARLHLVVRSEPDPRFVFQFGGEPECSPVVYQIQGNIRQPVFSCKFSADRNSRYRSQLVPSEFGRSSWQVRSFTGENERQWRERKGWMIMIYDLSGSPAACASMITPFVPSPGTDRVSRSNPGAWLILRTHGQSLSSWKPWGRLEAWRERGHVDGLGYKFELVTETGPTSGIPIAEGTMNVKKGGKFCIDGSCSTPCRLGPGTQASHVEGFVMGSTVEGEGKVSKPVVQVAVKHVTRMADAALFIALSAAVDLSMDACQIFSRKLRKELCHENHDSVS